MFKWFRCNQDKKEPTRTRAQKTEYEKMRDMFALGALMESQAGDVESKNNIRMAMFKSMVDSAFYDGYFEKCLQRHPELKEHLPIIRSER